MCGIWLYIQHINSDTEDCLWNLEKANAQIKKRGPDRSVMKKLTFGDYQLFLGFHRLAIMDLSEHGDQPFILDTDNCNEQIYLMCNGEIYGYLNLVKEFGLESRLKSHSDCEVLIHLYKILGLEGLYKILTTRDDVSGEFAMTILHVREDTLDIHYMRDFCGKRPLYCSQYIDQERGIIEALCLTSQLCGVPFKSHKNKVVDQIKGSTFGTYKLTLGSRGITHLSEKTELLSSIPITIYDEEEACRKIYETFIRIVRDQLVSDRPIVFMLSGGLDSSVCACVGAHIYRESGYKNKIKTVCIGLEGGTDEIHAKTVAEFIGSQHTHIMCEDREFIDCAENRITEKIESYDITSNRASVPQLISAEKIREMTDCKVVIVGDYADEVCGGYNETKYAPTVNDYANRIHELVDEIIYFDGKRVDRCIGGSGLEARMPFGDHRFIKLYLSIDPELRMPRDGCEKYLLRKAFDGKNIIPQSVLWRPKEAFSDGVSSLKRSWYQIVLDHFDKKYLDEDLERAKIVYKINTPYTKESLHYRIMFDRHFSDTNANVIPKFWLPKWGNVKEPSARVLDVYRET